MAEKRKLEYFLLRYVPNVVRGEFVNIGLVMTESGGDGGGFAGVHFTKDWRHVRCFDPQVDTKLLEAIGRDVEVRLKNVNQRAVLLHEMMDSYSSVLQLSPTQCCYAEDPAQELKDLASKLVEIQQIGISEEESAPRRSGRSWIHSEMSAAFRAADVWDFLMKDLPASPYTNNVDDFTFDFAYAVGTEIKLFHAISLATVGVETRMFPLRVAKIGPRMAMLRKMNPIFTAVSEDSFDEKRDEVAAVLAFMKDEGIKMARVKDMTRIAEDARRELGV
jgi:hypothetical protein